MTPTPPTRRETAILAAITLVAAALRLYRPGLERLTSDELRILYWSRLMAHQRTLEPFNVIDSQWTLVPVHSPLTNYITALSYLLVDNATAARVIYGVLGVVAVVTAVAVARRFFGVTAAVMTGLLLAVHGPLIEWSRFAWNPNWGQAVGVLWIGTALLGFYGRQAACDCV